MTISMNAHENLDKQRRAARRTALVLGLVALGVFVAFIASVVLK